PFGECADTGCSDSGPRVDLRNVATHEFGHFLGLAHSDVEGATMYCAAYSRDVSKRYLGQDDIDGLCAVYPPEQETVIVKRRDGCALGGEAGGGLAFALLMLLAGRRRRR
ncbi:MAG TPA: matrixin family metalloprotease, partial [Polyangiales bacterium]|nr:matrixin family metalloprotease [Polyangiales bacterium]